MTLPKDVRTYIDGIRSATRQRDALTLVDMMSRVTGESPRMQGSSVVGFGSYHYRYESGREGDAAAAGFAARKASTTVYLLDGIGPYAGRLARLGEHSTGVGCIYIKDLDRVDLEILEDIIAESYGTLTGGTYAHRARASRDGRPEA